jgi:hypothetical protein
METKSSLASSTYKQLSKGNEGWKKVYIAENPWNEMAVDVDSLVFFYIRKYVEIPYPTRKDERMVCASFIHDTTRSTRWIVEDMARYSINQLAYKLKYLKSIGLVLHPVYSTGYPRLKRELRDERLRTRSDIERTIRELDPMEDGVTDAVLSSIKRYILHFRDEVRDIVVKQFRLHRSTEADKWCGRNYRVTMSEDVDIFLFGNKRTIIVKPFLGTPTHFDFIDCKSYFTDKGIATYDDFIQVAFMVGTDYNRGIKGMGVKRSVEAIAKYSTVAKYVTTKYDLTDDNVGAYMEVYKKFIKYITKD